MVTQFKIITDQLEIVGGPSRLGLMSSLFEGLFEEDVEPAVHRTRVVFKMCKLKNTVNVGGIFTLNVGIISMEQEDGSGESWNFKGITEGGNCVNGYYSTKTSGGYMETFGD